MAAAEGVATIVESLVTCHATARHLESKAAVVVEVAAVDAVTVVATMDTCREIVLTQGIRAAEEEEAATADEFVTIVTNLDTCRAIVQHPDEIEAVWAATTRAEEEVVTTAASRAISLVTAPHQERKWAAVARERVVITAETLVICPEIVQNHARRIDNILRYIIDFNKAPTDGL